MPANSTHAVRNNANNPAIVASTNTGNASGDPQPTTTNPAVDLSQEPDQDAIVAIKTGRLVWTHTRTDKLVAPYKNLPFPKSDCAKLPPRTVRWQLSWDRMRRKQEGPKSYEEWCRNHKIGQNEGLQQSSLRSVVERLYDRSHPNRYERDLTAKPAGISSIMIIQQISRKPVRGH